MLIDAVNRWLLWLLSLLLWLLWLLPLSLLLGCGATPKGREADPARFRLRVDPQAVESWLFCRRAGGSYAVCKRASASTKGGTIAEAAVATFPDAEVANDPLPSVEVIDALLAGVRAWPLEAVVGELDEYLPKPAVGETTLFLVANGHRWGDAYVRTVKLSGVRPKLDEDGEPVIVLNLVRIASTYRGPASRQARSTLGVVKHEIFHVMFQGYRRSATQWQLGPESNAPLPRLLITVLNEGVAHFADRRARLLAEGFPPDRARASLTRLAEVVERLTSGPLPASESQALLASGSTGRYWDKYAAISGMLLAYGVFEAFGAEGIRDTVRCGPGRLLTRYVQAVERRPELMPLPPGLLEVAYDLDLCLPARRTVGVPKALSPDAGPGRFRGSETRFRLRSSGPLGAAGLIQFLG